MRRIGVPIAFVRSQTVIVRGNERLASHALRGPRGIACNDRGLPPVTRMQCGWVEHGDGSRTHDDEQLTGVVRYK